MAFKKAKGKVDDWWVSDSIKKPRFDHVYSTCQELGRGATATVLKVQHLQTGNFYAGKIVKKKDTIKFVRSEISVLLRLDHPNIIKLHEIYESKNHVSLVLELVTGGELFDSIVQRGYYSEKDAIIVTRQLLEAISYLHQNGIVHRDLKPENILYESKREDARIKITDFGLAKDNEDGQVMDTVCGTPGYTAPEILMQTGYGQEVDVWSIGVIVYILLCGYEPFSDDRGVTYTYKNIIKADYEFHSEWWDDISMDAKDFVSKILVVDFRQRLTAERALHHSWIRAEEPKLMNLTSTVKNIREFNARRKLKAATKAVLASRRVLKGLSRPNRDATLPAGSADSKNESEELEETHL